MDEIHQLRETYGADLVVLMIHRVNNTQGSVAAGVLQQSDWSRITAPPVPLQAPYLEDWRKKGFCVVEVNTIDYFSFHHEIGHILGCAHGVIDLRPATYTWHHGVFADSEGNHFGPTPTGFEYGQYRSIMAYNRADTIGYEIRVNRWSDPSTNYQVGGTSYPVGIINSKDNARTLGITAPVLDKMTARRNWAWNRADVDVDGWRKSDWYGWLHVESHPWDYHVYHGWQFVTTDDENNLWTWDLNLGSYAWTSRSYFPWIWVDSVQQWWKYIDGTTNPRQFEANGTVIQHL